MLSILKSSYLIKNQYCLVIVFCFFFFSWNNVSHLLNDICRGVVHSVSPLCQRLSKCAWRDLSVACVYLWSFTEHWYHGCDWLNSMLLPCLNEDF